MRPKQLIYTTTSIVLLLLASGCLPENKLPTQLSKIASVQAKNDVDQVQSEKLFPDDVGWINIKEDYGAKGDGQTDDTAAIMQAIKDNFGDYNRPTVIYFPQGTYLLSDTLEFPQEFYYCCIYFQGQGVNHTVLKLKDNTPAFGNDENPRAVIKTKKGNMSFRYYIRDLTLNTGSGNPGAIGIDYIANNRGAIKDVKIKSDDGEGQAGIEMTREWAGPSLIKNVLIEGFNYGIRASRVEYSMTLEHITLKNQKIAGIFNKQNTLAIRGLKSNNSVPVLHNREGGLVILLDSEFQEGLSSISAIDNNAYLYARNIKTSGYRSAIRNQGEIIPNSSISEYISHEVYSLFGNPKSPLNLPIEETPSFHDNNLNNWANVKDYPSIQAAMESGKSTIYFPRGNYEINEPINIPATVRKIVGFESFINLDVTFQKDLKVVWKIKEDSKHPLIFEGLILQSSTVEHQSPRTLVIKHSKVKPGSNTWGQVLRNSPNAGKLFLEDVQMFLHLDHPQNVWARQLNPESRYKTDTVILNKGGTLWILGLKVEGTGTVIKTTDGGKTEMLGNHITPGKKFDEQAKRHPAFINQESDMSLIYSYSYYGKNWHHKTLIEETRNGKTKVFKNEEMPGRIMPLFVGTKNNKNWLF